jgi:hypothetical protein
MKLGRPIKDRIGNVYGRWIIISYDHSGKNNVSFYLCRCQCGKEAIIEYASLQKGKSKSCGCLQKDSRSEPHLVSARSVYNANYSNGCSFDKFLELSQESCYYCGSPPANRYNTYVNSKNEKKANGLTVPDGRAHQAWFIYNGLDRLDPSKNHNEDNVVPCCAQCNVAKLDMTVNEFRTWLIRVYNNFIASKIPR